MTTTTSGPIAQPSLMRMLIDSIRSEWTKLGRRNVLLGGIGTILGFALLLTIVGLVAEHHINETKTRTQPREAAIGELREGTTIDDVTAALVAASIDADRVYYLIGQEGAKALDEARGFLSIFDDVIDKPLAALRNAPSLRSSEPTATTPRPCAGRSSMPESPRPTTSESGPTPNEALELSRRRCDEPYQPHDGLAFLSERANNRSTAQALPGR